MRNKHIKSRKISRPRVTVKSNKSDIGVLCPNRDAYTRKFPLTLREDVYSKKVFVAEMEKKLC